MINEIISISLLIVVIIYCFISDIRKMSISNIFLLVFGILGLILNTIYGLNNIEVYKIYLLGLLFNSLLSIILYICNIYSAGDSKYLICLSLLTPIFIYERIGKFYSVVLAILYSFSVGYMYLIVQSIIFFFRKEKYKQMGKISINSILEIVYTFIKNFIFIETFECIYKLVFKDFYDTYYVFLIILSIILISLLGRIKKNIINIVLIVICTIFIIIENSYFKISFINIVVVFMQYFINLFISGYNYQTICIKNLKQGMILSANSTMLLYVYNFENMPRDISEGRKARLTKENIIALNKMSKATKIEMVDIVRKIPFAAFISIGYILFIIQGYLL